MSITAAQLAELLDKIRTNTYDSDTLDLHNCNLGNAEAEKIAIALKDNQRIKHLNLSNNNISDDGIIALAKILPTTALVSLDLSYNKFSSDAGIVLAKALNESRITDLNLQYNRVSDDTAKILAQNKLLTRLNLKQTDIHDSGYRLFENNNVLTSLEVSPLLCDDAIFKQINAKINRNNKIQQNKECWSETAVLIAFHRANRGHIFAHSIKPLISSLVNLTRNEQKKLTTFNLDRFMDTQFFNHENDKQNHSNKPSCCIL